MVVVIQDGVTKVINNDNDHHHHHHHHHPRRHGTQDTMTGLIVGARTPRPWAGRCEKSIVFVAVVAIGGGGGGGMFVNFSVNIHCMCIYI